MVDQRRLSCIGTIVDGPVEIDGFGRSMIVTFSGLETERMPVLEELLAVNGILCAHEIFFKAEINPWAQKPEDVNPSNFENIGPFPKGLTIEDVTDPIRE